MEKEKAGKEYMLKNLNYNEKNCNKRIEFAREKWRCDLQVVKRDRKSVFRVPVDLNEEILKPPCSTKWYYFYLLLCQ